MKTKHKIIIDALVGTPLSRFINWLARITGYFLRIDHSLDKDFQTITISKYAGLGSIIQATPLIQSLRKKYPSAKLIFVSTKGNAALLSHIPEINVHVFISDKSVFSTITSSIRAVFKLWQLKIDVFIDLEFYSNYSGIMTTFSLATNRMGFYNKHKSFRKGMHNYLIPFNVNTPISETYLQFAELLNCKEKVNALKLEISSSVSWNSLKTKMNLNTQEAFIIINPNASDLRIERRWPKESFIQTIRYILTNYPSYQIVLIGSLDEKPYVNTLLRELAPQPKLINTAGILNISELIFIVRHARLMLTNDTGPMHIAFALNTPTISLFGPCSPEQYGKNPLTLSFYKQVPCSPCVHTHVLPPCRGNNICMKNIQVEEVQMALSTILK